MRTNWIFSVVLIGQLLSSCTQTEQTNQNGAEKIGASPDDVKKATVYVANSVITMDHEQPRATAVAVAGSKIISVGDLPSIRTSLKGYELEIDQRFADKVILPGLIDNHFHPTLGGILLPAKFITPFDWTLPSQQVKGVQGRENYLGRLHALEASLIDPQELLITWGYHQYFHGKLTRKDLDKISKTRAIIVWQRSFHEIVVNSPALVTLGLNEADFADHPAIDYENGHFWELGLFDIFPKLLPLVLEPGRFGGGMRDAMVHAQMNGITTLVDQGAPLLNLDMETELLSKVLEDFDLPIRVLIIGNGITLAKEGLPQALSILDSLPDRDNDEIQFIPKQVKLFADGAFYSQLMQMEDPYLDGHHGEWIMQPDDLETAARAYWNAAYQLHIHVNGDKGVNVILQIIEKLQLENPRPGHKTTLHHYGYSAPDHAERIADMGIMVSANPFYLWALGEKYASLGLGPERAHHITRLGDLERNGVPVSFHSDLPMAPAAPLMLAGIAASRVSSSGNILAPEEKMSIDAALRGITIDAARAIQFEDRIGSIEVGKQADFTVVEQDPFTIEPEHFSDINIWGTVLGGQVFARPGFE